MTKNQEKSTIQKQSKAEIEKILTLSTHNISEGTAEWLDSQLYNKEQVLTVYSKKEYGWFVPVYSSVLEKTIPEDLMKIAKYALDLGCQWIMFDRDVDVNEELPSFEW